MACTGALPLAYSAVEHLKKPATLKQKNPAIQKMAGFFIYLGWLMGLEPTTTGITILTFYHFQLSINVDINYINQHLTLILERIW